MLIDGDIPEFVIIAARKPKQNSVHLNAKKIFGIKMVMILKRKGVIGKEK